MKKKLISMLKSNGAADMGAMVLIANHAHLTQMVTLIS